MLRGGARRRPRRRCSPGPGRALLGSHAGHPRRPRASSTPSTWTSTPAPAASRASRPATRSTASRRRSPGATSACCTAVAGACRWVQHVTTACHHCLDPACMHACPVEAYEKDPVTGIVEHLDDQCFGCQYCTLACPYEAPKYSRSKGIVRKCDMCSDRLADGEAPACVQSCPNGAIAIRVVDVEQVIEESETHLFVPGAPEPALTLPTTAYRTERALPRNMVPADYHTVRPEQAHWSLILMLALTQLSVGAFLVERLLELLVPGGADGRHPPRAQRQRAGVRSACAGGQRAAPGPPALRLPGRSRIAALVAEPRDPGLRHLRGAGRDLRRVVLGRLGGLARPPHRMGIDGRGRSGGRGRIRLVARLERGAVGRPPGCPALGDGSTTTRNATSGTVPATAGALLPDDRGAGGWPRRGCRCRSSPRAATGSWRRPPSTATAPLLCRGLIVAMAREAAVRGGRVPPSRLPVDHVAETHGVADDRRASPT